MAKATSSFYFKDRFYLAGDDVPKEVAKQVGKHLFAVQSQGDDNDNTQDVAQEDQEATQGDQAPPSDVNTQGDDADASQDDEALTRELLEELSAKELVELAKEAGITGKHNKAELIEKLLEGEDA